MIRASSSVDATMPAPSAAAVITSSERLNPCCATTCPDDGHEQRQPRRRLVEERLERRLHPGLERAHQAEPARRVEHLQPGEPDVRVGADDRDQHQVVRPGRGEHRAPLARGAGRSWAAAGPPPRRCGRRRPTRLPASAAMARPSTPSMSCSATTRPSVAETSSAPRTPGTRVTRSSSARVGLTARAPATLRGRARGALGEQSRRVPSAATGLAPPAAPSRRWDGTRKRVAVGRFDRDRLPRAESEKPGGARGLARHPGQLRGDPIAGLLAVAAPSGRPPGGDRWRPPAEAPCRRPPAPRRASSAADAGGTASAAAAAVELGPAADRLA